MSQTAQQFIPLQPGTLLEPTQAQIEATAEALMAKATGMTREAAMEAATRSFSEEEVFHEIWFSPQYTVLVRRNTIPEEVTEKTGWPQMHWLSIRRDDRLPMRNWRHLQAIKNQLVGPEHEGFEVFPAESRLVDTANQYHLWVMADPEPRLPFGFGRREVINASRVLERMGAMQEPFENDFNPAHIKTASAP